ncbi:hypothetical protein G6F57_020348 [Rhizopus arrhizus]|nr:hypothetical protein G6F57_020348 [Rhizopus arrhizus]
MVLITVNPRKPSDNVRSPVRPLHLACPLQRNRQLRRHRRPETGRDRRPDLAAAAADPGRARHGQDNVGRRSGARAGPPPAAMAHQVHDQGAPGPSETSATTSCKARCGKPSRRTSRWCS